MCRTYIDEAGIYVVWAAFIIWNVVENDPGMVVYMK